MMALTHCQKLSFFTMIFAGFEEKSIKGSYRFRVMSAFKSRENRSLAGIGGDDRKLKSVGRGAT
jgi:hypothetical protein